MDLHVPAELARSLAETVVRRARFGPLDRRWSLQFEAFVGAMRATRVRIAQLDMPAQRKAWEEAGLPPSPVSRRVRVHTEELGGVRCTFAVPRACRSGCPTILYFHGGGYGFGSFRTHAELVYRLALASPAIVVVPDYSLAPERPFPAALDDALSTYRALVDRAPDRGVCVAGDSAGGGLTAALLVRARDAGLPMPRGGVMLSPWVDLAEELADPARARTDWLDGDWGQVFARRYLGETPASDPRASPVHADLGGLPRLLVQVGDAEILHDQGLRFVDAARRAGVRVDLQVEPGMPHSFHLFAPLFRACEVPIERIGAFVRACCVERGSGDC